MDPGASNIVADLGFFFTYFFVGDIFCCFFLPLNVWVRLLDGSVFIPLILLLELSRAKPSVMAEFHVPLLFHEHPHDTCYRHFI